MANFSNIDNSLNNSESTTNYNSSVEIELVTLGGVSTEKISYGMTVGDFKRTYNLVGKKFVNEEGDELTDAMRLVANQQIFISAPKKNG